jgi:hypothetical protein
MAASAPVVLVVVLFARSAAAQRDHEQHAAERDRDEVHRGEEEHEFGVGAHG